MAKKFIRGSYEIKDKINNLDKFVKINKPVFDELETFGNNNGVGFNIGTGYDGTNGGRKPTARATVATQRV